jgi:hypothetical protein
MTMRRVISALTLFSSLAALSATTGSVRAGVPDGEVPPAYERFVEDGRGLSLLRIARRAYASAALGHEPFLAKPSLERRRPAGPRDEPPPPEWPEAPVGLVLCLRIDGKVRACEGEMEPASRNLSKFATSLAERLASGRSRGKKKVKSEEISRGVMEAWFIRDVSVLEEEEFKAAGREGGLDLGRAGLIVDGAGGRVVVLPGEATSWRRVVRIARKAGVVKMFKHPETVRRFAPLPAGEPLEINP